MTTTTLLDIFVVTIMVVGLVLLAVLMVYLWAEALREELSNRKVEAERRERLERLL